MSVAVVTVSSMMIDCEGCPADTPSACGDCIVPVLLGMPAVVSTSGAAAPHLRLDPIERNAFRVLADAGLIAPLELSDEWLDDSEWDADIDFGEYRAGYA